MPSVSHENRQFSTSEYLLYNNRIASNGRGRPRGIRKYKYCVENIVCPKNAAGETNFQKRNQNKTIKSLQVAPSLITFKQRYSCHLSMHTKCINKLFDQFLTKSTQIMIYFINCTPIKDLIILKH